MAKKKMKKMTVVTTALFVAAASLLGLSGIGAARAATIYQSQEYDAQLEMHHVGVALLEKEAGDESARTVSENYMGEETDSSVIHGTLLSKLVPDGEDFALNKAYTEEISVQNIGSIDEYVRVVLDLYWLNEDGTEKVTELSPQLIKLELADNSGWILDPDSSYLNGTGEQLILYYSTALEPDEKSNPLSTTLTIDGSIANTVSQTEENGVITTNYLYDGIQFAMSAETDAIQTHSGSDAALASWGVELNAQSGKLSLSSSN